MTTLCIANLPKVDHLVFCDHLLAATPFTSSLYLRIPSTGKCFRCHEVIPEKRPQTPDPPAPVYRNPTLL